jgi:hypothetical protein
MIEWLTAKPRRNATVEWLHASSTRAQKMLNWRAIRLIAQVAPAREFGITAEGFFRTAHNALQRTEGE